MLSNLWLFIINRKNHPIAVSSIAMVTLPYISLFIKLPMLWFANIGSIVENVRDLNKEVPPVEELMVEPNIVKGRFPLAILFNCSSTKSFVTEAEAGAPLGDIPTIEPLENDNNTTVSPVAISQEPIQIDGIETAYDILTREVPNAPNQIQDVVDNLPLPVSEDYEVSHPVSEPHVGLPLPSTFKHHVGINIIDHLFDDCRMEMSPYSAPLSTLVVFHTKYSTRHPKLSLHQRRSRALRASVSYHPLED